MQWRLHFKSLIWLWAGLELDLELDSFHISYYSTAIAFVFLQPNQSSCGLHVTHWIHGVDAAQSCIIFIWACINPTNWAQTHRALGAMKLQCDVEVVSRMLPTFGMKRNGKGVRAVLSIGKHVDKNTQRNIYLMICTAKDRAGSKYKVLVLRVALSCG